MLHLRRPFAASSWLLLVALLACEATGPADAGGPPANAEPYTLAMTDQQVSLSIQEGGIPTRDFVKVAQHVTGRVFSYRADDLAGDDQRISLIGTITVPRDEFMGFVKTLLHAHGFDCVEQRAGETKVVELVPLT